MFSRYKRLVRQVLFFLGLLFVAILVGQSWEEISLIIWKIDGIKFLISIVIALFGNFTMAIMFNRLLAKHGVFITGRLALKLYMTGQVVKYIPGKIWTVAYQASHVSNLASAMSVLLVNMEMMLTIMLMTTFVAFSLFYFPDHPLFAFLILSVGMIFFLVLYKTRITLEMLRYLAKRIKVIGDFSEMETTPPTFASGWIFYIVFILTYILSYTFMFYAIFGLSFQESAFHISLLSLAWIAGVIIFIFPVGIGARELIFVAGSHYIVPEQTIAFLVSIAVITRFWQIIQDLSGVFTVTLLKKDRVD